MRKCSSDCYLPTRLQDTESALFYISGAALYICSYVWCIKLSLIGLYIYTKAFSTFKAYLPLIKINENDNCTSKSNFSCFIHTLIRSAQTYFKMQHMFTKVTKLWKNNGKVGQGEETISTMSGYKLLDVIS